ncbi:MAG: NAD-dependent epimerase/dehydratase family protein [Armatimonadota bacterium]
MDAAYWTPGATPLPTPTRAELAELPEITAPKSGRRVFKVVTPLIRSDDDLAAALLWHYTNAVECIKDGLERVDLILDVSLIDAYPQNWSVTAAWKPFFKLDRCHLAAFGIEQVWRECLRDRGVRLAIHRLDSTSDTDTHYDINSIEFNKHRFLHIVDTYNNQSYSNEHKSDYLPHMHMPSWPNVSEPVAVLGAGGPIPTSAIELLKQRHDVILCDHEPLETIASRGAPHQPKGAPLPALPVLTPHREETFDLLDRTALRAAITGCATLVNCACTRYKQNDFRVNTVGALVAAEEAIACGVKRIVTTGPQVITLEPYTGFHHDHDVPIDTPGRPGCNPYGLSKHIGQELVRVLCEHSDVQGITLLFNGLATPESIHPIDYMTTFADAGRAIQAAVEADANDITYTALHILAAMPHGHFRLDRIKNVLDWMPEDSLPSIWRLD